MLRPVLLMSVSAVITIVSPISAFATASASVSYSSLPTLATFSPSAIAVGTSVNIIVSDNNIARIRCFITFTS